MTEEIKKDLKVIYSSECTESYSSGERFGEWSAAYDFRVHSFTTEVPGNPSWDWVWESDINPSKDEIPNELYCVWVRYSDGDSFGGSTGNGQVVGLFKSEDAAHALAKSIVDDSYRPSGQGYKTWNGYFNRLESVEVDKIPHENAKYPKSYKPKDSY